jgi:hypothetical protein
LAAICNMACDRDESILAPVTPVERIPLPYVIASNNWSTFST